MTWRQYRNCATEYSATMPESLKSKFKKIPTHIAIIMDGNGRWAKERNLPRIAGHRQGVQNVELVLETVYCCRSSLIPRDRLLLRGTGVKTKP